MMRRRCIGHCDLGRVHVAIDGALHLERCWSGTSTMEIHGTHPLNVDFHVVNRHKPSPVSSYIGKDHPQMIGPWSIQMTLPHGPMDCMSCGFQWIPRAVNPRESRFQDLKLSQRPKQPSGRTRQTAQVHRDSCRNIHCPQATSGYIRPSTRRI